MTALTVEKALAQRENNFDLLRLMAALLVIASHSYPLTGRPSPFVWATGRDLGSLAVCVFFVISGLLVTRSLERNDGRSYFAGRALRILPALFVVCFAQTFVLGPIFTTLPLAEYLRAPQTFDGLRSILVFDIRFTLPGVFLGHPAPGAVNGSLWTLPIEAFFYLLLPVLLMFGLLKPGWTWLPLAALMVVRFCLHNSGMGPGNTGPALLSTVATYPAVDFGILFFAGSLFWVHRTRISLNGGFALCALCLLFAARNSISTTWAFYLAMPYLVIYLALATSPFRLPVALGDISYGVYLYGFPLQQTVVALAGSAASPGLVTLFAAPMAIACAALSWRLVEKPALRLKSRLSGSR